MRPSKRDAVLETAERLFYEQGFHATGIDQIVSEAGVARMTLYNHFPSKEALVEAVLVRRYGCYLDDLRQAIAQAEAGSAVRVLVERHCEWLARTANHGCIVIKAISELEYHFPAIAELGRRLKRDLLDLITAAQELDAGMRVSSGSERILMILEGANALAPVLGAQNTIALARAMLTSDAPSPDGVSA